MSSGILMLRRRNIVERKVVQIMRQGVGGLSEEERAHFARLRAAARPHALQIASEGAYLTVGEALILRWLAEAQREAGLRTLRLEDDGGLRGALVRCAEILKLRGLFLPPRTLSIGFKLKTDDAAPSERAAPYEAASAWARTTRSTPQRRTT